MCLSTVFVVVLFASAVFADDFAGTSSGVFVNPTGPAGMVTTGVGSSFFTWGDGTAFGSPPSSLQFTGTLFSGLFEAEFSFGTLSYFNGTIAGGTEANSVDLLTTLAFTLPPGITQDFSFLFQLINTPNTTDPAASADIVQLGTAFDPTSSFTGGGTEYFLQFTRFGNVGPGGFITGVDEFHVLEGQTASAQVFGKLTSSPVNPEVPEPCTMLLLGSGLAGLVGLRRKLKK
jgi:hypothetical protein